MGVKTLNAISLTRIVNNSKVYYDIITNKNKRENLVASLKSIDGIIEDLEKKLHVIDNQQPTFLLKQTPNEVLDCLMELAILIHDSTCKSNHTDACGWLYEKNGDNHDWLGSSHRMYLDKAVEVSHKMLEYDNSIDTLQKVIELYKLLNDIK